MNEELSYAEMLEIPVETVTVRRKESGKKRRSREDLADASTQAYGLADSRYRHGAATYLEVLDAQRSMVSARQALISTQLSRAASRVTFFKVLGGGAELPATEETTKQANG